MAAKLLLAEDSLTIQKVFELTFKQSGIALTVVDNGDDAVRLAREISPDLVIADVSLPGKDGFEVASELRSGEGSGACPVLILAGTLAPFDEERFKGCGADGVLFKPFESQELLDRVGALLRGREEPAPAAEEGEPAAPPAEEPWDFSDVLDEAEEEAGAAAGGSGEAAVDDLVGVASASLGDSESALSLKDFDVSLEEIEGEPEKEPVAAATEPAFPGERHEEPEPHDAPGAALLPPEHFEAPVFEDSPPAVTDLSPSVEVSEELEELEILEEVEDLEDAVAEPAPSEEFPGAPDAVFPEAADAEPADAPAADGPLPGEEELRALFSARAQEIFEKVAAETVEKVLWEVMEDLTKELAGKIRESVEAVAWEVVPATAEALIKEEIARIREQAGKDSS